MSTFVGSGSSPVDCILRQDRQKRPDVVFVIKVWSFFIYAKAKSEVANRRKSRTTSERISFGSVRQIGEAECIKEMIK